MNSKTLFIVMLTLSAESIAAKATIVLGPTDTYTVLRTASDGAQWAGAFRAEIKNGSLASLNDCLSVVPQTGVQCQNGTTNKKAWVACTFPLTQTEYWDILNGRPPKMITICKTSDDPDDSTEVLVSLKGNPKSGLYERIADILPGGAQKSLTAVDCLSPSEGRAKCKATPYGCTNDCPSLAVDFEDESGKAIVHYLDGRSDSDLTKNLSQFPVIVNFTSSTTAPWAQRVANVSEIVKSTLCIVAPRLTPSSGGFCVSHAIASPDDGISATLFAVDKTSASSAFSIGKGTGGTESSRIQLPLRGVAISAGVTTDFSSDQTSHSSFYYRKFDWNSPVPKCQGVESALVFARAPKDGCGRTTLAPLDGAQGHPFIAPMYQQSTDALLCNLGQTMVWTTDWATPMLTPTELNRPFLKDTTRSVVGLFIDDKDNSHVAIACRGEVCQYKGSKNWTPNSNILSHPVRPGPKDDLSAWGEQLEYLSSAVGFDSVSFVPELCQKTLFKWTF